MVPMIEVNIPEFKPLDRILLSGIKFSLQEGERIAILGGNRSGKTVLSLLIAGWLPIRQTQLSGSVSFEGRPWAAVPLAERASAVQFVGCMPQQQLSGREFTVRDEIAFGAGNLCLPVEQVRSRVDEVMTLCGLHSIADRDPFTLSGGEQQMVVLAGALAMHPRMLVMDEAMSHLDPDAAERVLSILDELPPSMAIVWTDVSPRVAIRFASRYLLLNNGNCVADGCAKAVLSHRIALRTLGESFQAETIPARLSEGSNA